MLKNFKEISLKKPSDQIVHQIRDLISTGVLKAGDRLPSERALADKFAVGRGHIREALKKLELCGVLKTLPQSGTVVVGLGVEALEGLIGNILHFEKYDLVCLLEIRLILEINAARLAAMRATKANVIELIRVHEHFRKHVKNNDTAVAEDRLFHIKVAEFSKNTVLRSFITIITPEVFSVSNSPEAYRRDQAELVLNEHEIILQAIKQKDPEKAAKAMQGHLDKQ
ncbi:MAG: FadR family transcriptional regulator [Deltaproteobacteria bacterium]|nr:FadR family transcriptional regulator [Deltaproteobacteria bacterium]MBW1960134.1 FadR family transcriptional regulator [Deltaproteobacteria bacterium]MBW1993201.1 FadR family transcriptional regulator [Deltaproteobacteria bacterium]MBW2151382.1 FadR family transcriptional regulator [Deltaproteobacteria bacterium]